MGGIAENKRKEGSEKQELFGGGGLVGRGKDGFKGKGECH